LGSQCVPEKLEIFIKILRSKMRYFRLMIAGVIMAGSTFLSGCNESPERKAENVEQAESKLVKAEDELEKSQSDSAMAYTTFKSETDRILAANEIKMLELKASMLASRSEISTQYEKDLEALRIENEKLKSNLETFTYGTNENWENFKTNVNRDIDRLGKSISAMAEKAEKKKN